MTLEPLRVALPLGVGDAVWSCQKLRALSVYHGGRPIHAYINKSRAHMTVGFLELVPFIEKAIESPQAPYDIWGEMLPSPHDPKWSTLEFCRGWNGFDYIMVANGHLERGGRMETWLPELDTDFSFPLNIQQADRDAVAGAKNRPLVYLSGTGPNRGFHANWWMPGDWVQVLSGMLDAGMTPVLVGANTDDDKGYRDIIVRLLGSKKGLIEDRVGQTTLPQYCAIIEAASVWVGLNSGGGIVSAMRGTPTVMLWADHRYPLANVHPRNHLHANMQRSWLTEAQCETYRTLSYGSPELTPDAVVKAAAEVMRK